MFNICNYFIEDGKGMKVSVKFVYIIKYIVKYILIVWNNMIL